jgi:hypothetical protein
MKQQKKYRDSEVERNTNHTKSNEETQNGDLQRPNRTMLVRHGHSGDVCQMKISCSQCGTAGTLPVHEIPEAGRLK